MVVILKARFWPKDLPQCFSVKCSSSALTKKTYVWAKSLEIAVQAEAFREILRAKDALQDDKRVRVGEVR